GSVNKYPCRYRWPVPLAVLSQIPFFTRYFFSISIPIVQLFGQRNKVDPFGNLFEVTKIFQVILISCKISYSTAGFVSISASFVVRVPFNCMDQGAFNRLYDTGMVIP